MPPTIKRVSSPKHLIDGITSAAIVVALILGVGLDARVGKPLHLDKWQEPSSDNMGGPVAVVWRRRRMGYLRPIISPRWKSGWGIEINLPPLLSQIRNEPVVHLQ